MWPKYCSQISWETAPDTAPPAARFLELQKKRVNNATGNEAKVRDWRSYLVEGVVKVG